MTTKTKSDYTPNSVKQAYNRNPDAGHFFDRDTMKFFGDRMSSYSTTNIDGCDYMYRKRTATVNVFGSQQRVGSTFFNAWKIIEEGGRVDLDCCYEKEARKVYDAIYK